MKMGLLSKEQLRELIKEKDIKTVSDIQNMLKEMFSETIQEMLEAELDTELGYPKNGDKPEGSANRRNGHSSKKVRSEYGEMEISVPRDREGEFEPVIVKEAPEGDQRHQGVDYRPLCQGRLRPGISKPTSITCTAWTSLRR